MASGGADVTGHSGSSRMDQSVANLLYNIEHYDGMIILITDAHIIDDMLLHRFKFILRLNHPDLNQRCKLWRGCIPNKVPLSDDVNLHDLARDYKQFNGGNIYNTVFRACSRAALDANGKVTMSQLRQSADQELKVIESNRFRSDAVKSIYV